MNITGNGNFVSSNFGNITINGKSYQGKNLSVQGNKVFIDGKPADETNDKVINISVVGNIEKLKVDYCEKIEVSGECGSIDCGSGNVKANTSGPVSTGSGDVEIEGSVAGNVRTGSGDVNVSGNVSGDVETGSGNIRYRK